MDLNLLKTKLKEDLHYHTVKKNKLIKALQQIEEQNDNDFLDFLKLIKTTQGYMLSISQFEKYKKCKHIPMMLNHSYELIPIELYNLQDSKCEALRKKQVELNGGDDETKFDAFWNMPPSQAPHNQMEIVKRQIEYEERAKVQKKLDEIRENNYKKACEEVNAIFNPLEDAMIESLNKQGWYSKSSGVQFQSRKYEIVLVSYNTDNKHFTLTYTTGGKKLKIKANDNTTHPLSLNHVMRVDGIPLSPIEDTTQEMELNPSETCKFDDIHRYDICDDDGNMLLTLWKKHSDEVGWQLAADKDAFNVYGIDRYVDNFIFIY